MGVRLGGHPLAREGPTEERTFKLLAQEGPSPGWSPGKRIKSKGNTGDYSGGPESKNPP